MQAARVVSEGAGLDEMEAYKMMERLTKKTGNGIYVWSDWAVELQDPGIIGATAREIIGICEDANLTPDDLREMLKKAKE